MLRPLQWAGRLFAKLCRQNVAFKHTNRGINVISAAIERPDQRVQLESFFDEVGVEWWSGGSLSDSMTEARKHALDIQLSKLGIDSDEFVKHDVANLTEQQSRPDSEGPVPDFMPAIRAYQHFVWPREKRLSQAISDSISDSRLQASAGRCARHVGMLLRKAQIQADVDFRNLDANRTPSGDSASDASANARAQSPCDSDAHSVVLVLDNIRSAFNTGNILRTAECVGLTGIVLCGITPQADSPAVAKAAIGAQHTLASTVYEESSLVAVQNLKAAGYTIATMETHGQAVHHTSVEYDKLACRKGGGGLAIVVGNEVNGVSHDILNESETILEIPCYGTKNSLNVSAAVPIVLYEIVRQLDAR